MNFLVEQKTIGDGPAASKSEDVGGQPISLCACLFCPLLQIVAPPDEEEYDNFSISVALEARSNEYLPFHGKL